MNKIELKASDYYRSFLSLLLGRPSNFSEVNSCLYASGIPLGNRAIKWLKKRGVNAVVSLTERPIRGSNQFDSYFNIPLINGEPASPRDLKSIVETVGKLIESGHCVLIHCSAGLGRTGMALASYFIYYMRMSPEEAVNKVKSMRPGSLTDPEQVNAVFKFAEWIRAKER